MFRRTMWNALIMLRNEHVMVKNRSAPNLLRRISVNWQWIDLQQRYISMIAKPNNWMHSLSWHIDWFIYHILIPCKQSLESHQKFSQHTNTVASKKLYIRRSDFFFFFYHSVHCFSRKILDVQLFKVSAILHWLAQFWFFFVWLNKYEKWYATIFFHSTSSAFTVRCPNIFVHQIYMCLMNYILYFKRNRHCETTKMIIVKQWKRKPFDNDTENFRLEWPFKHFVFLVELFNFRLVFFLRSKKVNAFYFLYSISN